MLSRRNFALALMLTTTGMTAVAQPPSRVVLVQYLVREQSAVRVEETITSPLERTLSTLERVSQLQSTTGHASKGHIIVNIEVHFEGGATEQDLATVMSRIAQVEFSGDLRASSISLHLRLPRLQ